MPALFSKCTSHHSKSLIDPACITCTNLSSNSGSIPTQRKQTASSCVSPHQCSVIRIVGTESRFAASVRPISLEFIDEAIAQPW